MFTVLILSLPSILLATGPKKETNMIRKGSFEFPLDSITKFPFYAESKLVILGSKNFSEYLIGDKIELTKQIPHNLSNITDEYIKGKMDRSGKIFIAKKDSLHSYNARLDYSKISDYSEKDFKPKIRGNFTHFSKVMDFNDYESYMSLVTNGSYLFEVKYFREKIFSFQISTTPRTKVGKILYMSYIDYGTKLATFFDDNTLILYKTAWPDYNQAVVSDYEFDERPLNVGQCDGVGLFAILLSRKVLFFDSKTAVMKKSYEFPDTEISGDPLVSCRSPDGTKTLLIFSPKKIFFLDIESMEMVTVEEIDPTTQSSWLYFLSGTDKFLSEEPIIDNNNEAVRTKYTAYEFTMQDPRFCHRTCGPKCESNFTPCSIFNKLFKYLLIISAVLILLVICLFIAFHLRGMRKRNFGLRNSGSKITKAFVKDEFDLEDMLNQGEDDVDLAAGDSDGYTKVKEEDGF